MNFWSLFRRGPNPDLPPEILREQLLEAANSGSPQRVLRFCRRHREAIVRHADALRQVPEDIRDSPWLVDGYMRSLIVAAQCLAGRLGDSRLLETLVGTEETNPILRWQRRIGALPGLLEGLQYEEAESLVREILVETQQNQGTGPRQYAAMAHGRLGEILFHSGRVRESLPDIEAALALCREIGDDPGVLTYLNNLVEAHRYLSEPEQAAAFCDALIAEQERLGETREADRIRKRAALLRAGEPLNRIVLQIPTGTYEMDEVSAPIEGRIQFVFERNRPQLQKAIALTRRGCERASTGEHATALDLFNQAAEADPYDPDPIYQAGVCLMEMGLWGAARRNFEQVEHLAPGWFRCRTDRWLAQQIETGVLPQEAFAVLRVIEDTGLPPCDQESLSRQALDQFEHFAPFWLTCGDALRKLGRQDEAIHAYRSGIARAEEPDVESRLTVALAGLLRADSPERQQLVQRALTLDGSLVAQATARLIALTGK